MARRFVLGLLAAAGVFSAATARAETKTESIKVGTLAPAESPWGQVFKVWQKAVRERTKLADGQKTADGKDYSLDMTFFWNGQQGDEAAMIGKMKSGQMDAAAVTAIGLSQVYKPILVFQLPGLFTEWGKLDHARDVMHGEFEKAVTDAGFVIVGWGDVGLARTMSKGFAAVTPSDIKGKHPYVWREDPITPILFQVVGGVTPVPGSVPEILPMLNTGAINVLTAPCLAAEQFQWASRLDHINTEVITALLGATIVTQKKLDALTADQRAVVMETGKVAGTALTARIRNEDNNAFNRLKAKMETAAPNDAQKAEWTDIFTKTRARLAQGIFPKDLINRAEELSK